jgi:hypothetical protein
MEFLDLKTLFGIGHIFGVVLGAGAAFVGDTFFMRAIRDQRFTKDEMKTLRHTSILVWIGVGLLVISGIGLFSLSIDRYIESTKFFVKMTIVAILILNGLIFHYAHIPFLQEQAGKRQFSISKEKSIPLLLSGVVSVVSWIAAILLGALRSIPISYGVAIGIYLVAILIAFAVAQNIVGRMGVIGEQK